jgi:hypothetical protein
LDDVQYSLDEKTFIQSDLENTCCKKIPPLGGKGAKIF